MPKTAEAAVTPATIGTSGSATQKGSLSKRRLAAIAPTNTTISVQMATAACLPDSSLDIRAYASRPRRSSRSAPETPSGSFRSGFSNQRFHGHLRTKARTGLGKMR